MGEDVCTPSAIAQPLGWGSPDWHVLSGNLGLSGNLPWCSWSHPFSSSSMCNSTLGTDSGIMKSLGFVDLGFCLVNQKLHEFSLERRWQSGSFCLFNGNTNRFLIRHWFIKLSVSKDRTNLICVFPPYFASGRNEAQAKCAAFMEMYCSTSWRIIFFLKAF